MDKKKVGIALLALPMFVSASVNYEKGTRNAQEYINTFSDYKKYILMGEAENGYGGFLSKNEFNLTYSNNRSYLAPGPAYWLKQEGNKKYIVDFSLKDVENGESGVRVTEFVKPETKVKGKGTQTTPWVFVNQYKVTVKSSNKSFGTIDENSKILYVEENGNVVVHIEPQPGYGYAGTSLDSELDSTITIEDVINEITLNNINSNEDVIVYFLPRSDVQYRVRHIFEGIGSIAPITQIDDNDSLKGTTGQLTNATALSNDSILEGFELDGNIEQKTISGGDGATVVDINYRRKSYTLTLNKSTGVKTVTGGGDYKFGADVDIAATLESGYALEGWYTNSDSENPYAYGRETSIEMPAGGLELTAKAFKSSSPDYVPPSGGSSSKRYGVTDPNGNTVYYPSLDKALSALGNNVIEGTSTLSKDGVPIASANTEIYPQYGTGVTTKVYGDTIKTTLHNCNVNCPSSSTSYSSTFHSGCDR